MQRNIRVRASQRARGCAHFQARLEPTRMRWEVDQVSMTSLETSEDTRALKTGSVHGGGYVHTPSDPALWLKVQLEALVRNFKAKRSSVLSTQLTSTIQMRTVLSQRRWAQVAVPL